MEELKLTFTLADNVRREKVHFNNRFGIELTGDLYIPTSLNEGETAQTIAICGPFGAVKEQASGYWANHLASQGFITLAFDPSFTGESAGEPRYVSSPDINTDDFSAAVDYLLSRKDVTPGEVGIIGICGWGGISINAAGVDPRIKATMAVTMYDMARNIMDNYYDVDANPQAHQQKREALNAQRLSDFQAGTFARAGGLPEERPDDNAPLFFQQYWDYYKTPRGYSSNSLNSNGGWNVTSALSWINTNLFAYAGEIQAPVMILHGDKAHSLLYGMEAFSKLHGVNKQFVLVPGATHCDLYDGGPEHDMIPWDTVIDFFKKNLKIIH